MVSLKHLFVTAKADGANTTLVKPSNWNEEHKFETAGDAVILGRTVGAGPGAVQELAMSAVFATGMVSAYAGATPPTGWFLCDGASLLRADNAALFAVIGTTYGPGSSPGVTFALPDLRGRVAAGADAGSGVWPGLTLGWKGGATEVALSVANLASHGHLHTLAISDPSHGHPFKRGDGTLVNPSTNATGVGAQYAGTGSYLEDAVMQGAFTGVSLTGSISAAGNGVAHNNVQPTIALNYIIKA